MGNPFTWCNRREKVANIHERLDRALVSSDWRILFPKAGVFHLSLTTSDHVPIMLHLYLDHPKTPRPFRFFKAWTRDPRCEQMVREAWYPRFNFGRILSITAKLWATTKALSVWNIDVFVTVRLTSVGLKVKSPI